MAFGHTLLMELGQEKIMNCKTLKPIKLLMIAPSPPSVGGITTWASYLIPYIAAHSEVELVHLDSAQRLRAIISTGFMQTLWTGVASWILLIFRLWKHLRRMRPDVIHSQTSARLGFFRDWVLIQLAHLYDVPVVIHFHFGRCSEIAKERNWEWKMLRRVVSAVDSVIVLDRKTVETLHAAGYHNVYLVPNPVAPSLEKIAAASASDSLQRKNKNVLFVGHVIAAKGVLELVAACVDLPEVEELRLIGPVEPPFRAEVIDFAKRRDAGRWLVFDGVKNSAEVLEAMRTAAVLALPSHLESSEAFPIVLLEAMAMGCPVIATTVAAMPDMLNASDNDRAGICVPPSDTAALRKALQQILENPTLGAQMGNCGRRRVVSNYNMDTVFKQYLDIYKTTSLKL